MSNVIGKIHSYESFGTVDGPGVRFVVFLQGCVLRCKYCHNPDSWGLNDNKKSQTPQELIKEVLKYKSFIQKGGVTITGGEPLLQAEFVYEFFKLCKQEGLHTAIDTSGFIFNDTVKKALEVTDLVLLDIKSINPITYKSLVGVELENTLKMAQYLSSIKKPMWVRHVLIDAWTDNDEDLTELANFLTTLDNIEKVEILPYHRLGEFKWEQLGMEYEFKDMLPPSDERVQNAKNIFKSKGIAL